MSLSSPVLRGRLADQSVFAPSLRHTFRHVAILVFSAACAAGDPTAPVVDPNIAGPAVRIESATADVNLASVGASEQVSVTVRDARGIIVQNAAVNWSIGDITVADVSGSGTAAIITARAPGRTVVIARVGILQQEFVVSVVGARSLAISPAAPLVRVGDRLALKAVVDAEAGARVEVRFQTDNPSIIALSSTGELVGLTPGTATVRANIVGDPRLTAVALVTVSPPREVRLTSRLLTTWVGDRTLLRATVDVDSSESRELTWQSTNPSVASVNSGGEVIALGVGTTFVRATSVADSRAVDSAAVQVLPERKVVVTPASVALGAGQTRVLDATVSIEAGLSRTVTWRSSNPAVAMISSDGMVTGVSQGTALMTAIADADSTRRGTAVVQIVPMVRDVDLQPAAASVVVGDTRQLIARVDADTGAIAAVIWRSSNAAVASVSATGLVRGVSAGAAIVTAISQQDTTVRATSLITVRNAGVVNVTPSSLTINPGVVRTLVANVQVDPGTSSAVRWRSMDPQIASVDVDGRVTGVSGGSTTVLAILVADSTRAGQASVTVVPLIRDISIAPLSAVVAPGASRQFAASVTGDAGINTGVLWRSSDPSIASITSNGLATATRLGAVTITAIAEGDTTKRASTTLTVLAGLSVSVTPSSVTLLTGQQQAVSATVQAAAGVSTAVTWTSANTNIATVDASGTISAVNVGSTTVTATSVADPTRQAVVAVTVSPQVQSVSVSPTTLNVAIGGTGSLSASVVAQGGLSTAVTWRSSNPAVATVNFAGAVSGLSAGSATITVLSVADTTRRATAAITVSNAPPPPPPPPPPATRLAASWSSSRLGGALYEDVISFDAIDAGNAFAVNMVGDVYRYAGGTWSLSASGATYGTQFQAIGGTSTSNVIAVGTNGVIARFNGGGWSAMSSGTNATLSGVWVESASSAFAVGASGTALRLSGSSWSVTSTGSSQSLNGVWSSGGVAVAVGNGGTMLRFNAGSWSSLASGTTETLYAVAGTSVSDVVAVGTFGTVRRYNGSSVVSVTSNTTADLYGIGGTSPMYIAGDDGVRQLSGSSVSTVSTPYAPRLFAVSADAAGAVWVSGQRGSVMRVSGGSWSTLNLAPDLIDVWTTAGNAAIAVGEFGSIFRWNGSSWTRQSTPTTATLNAVWAAGATDAFAGGDNGTMLRWNGSSWSAMSFPSSSSVYGLWGSSSSNVYAVTSTGQVVRFNGSAWSVVATAPAALWSIHGASASEIVAGGENGGGLRYNGSSWSTFNAPTTGTLAGVFTRGPGSYLAVGANANGVGNVAFSGTTGGWSATSNGSSRVLVSVWGTSATDVYATGEQGTILRFNGTSWTSMATGTSDLLWSVSGASDATGGFAVGYNSTVSVATSGTGLIASARAALSSGPANLNPQLGAKLVRGAVPSGKARGVRRGR